MLIKLKKLHPDAKIPQIALAGDAGADLFSVEDKILKPGERHTFVTGIAMKIPKGYVSLIWDKSGLSQKSGLKTLGGVLDSNYTGEYFVGLVNLGKEDYAIKKGQKLAQVLFQKVVNPKFKIVDELPKTNRGAGSHGSTGQ